MTAVHPDARVVASVDELWDDCDLVVVASPNATHAPIALEAARRGVPAVVDKPLAVTVDDAERVVSAAARLTVFHNRRWDDDFLTLRGVVEDGLLGDLVRFESRFERFRPDVDATRWREEPDPALGGGVLLDLGPHLVDQALMMLGPVESVYAEVRRVRPGARVEDDAFIALQHEGGGLSHLWMSAAAPLHGPRFRVSGTRAGFACDGLDVQEDQLRGGLTPADPSYGRTERTARLVDEGGERPVPIVRGEYRAFYRSVAAWLRDEGPPPVDPADALAGLRVLEAAREAGQTRSGTVRPRGTRKR